MTEEELKNKIAELIENCTEYYAYDEMDMEMSDARFNKGKFLNELIPVLKQAGYVQLDSNQSLPEVPYNKVNRISAYDVYGNPACCNGVPVVNEETDAGFIGYSEAQQDMKDANFKKVKDDSKT